MKQHTDIKIALALIAVMVFLLWLSVPIPNWNVGDWLAGAAIGLVCYCLIRLWRNQD